MRNICYSSAAVVKLLILRAARLHWQQCCPRQHKDAQQYEQLHHLNPDCSCTAFRAHRLVGTLMPVVQTRTGDALAYHCHGGSTYWLKPIRGTMLSPRCYSVSCHGPAQRGMSTMPNGNCQQLMVLHSKLVSKSSGIASQHTNTAAVQTDEQQPVWQSENGWCLHSNRLLISVIDGTNLACIARGALQRPTVLTPTVVERFGHWIEFLQAYTKASATYVVFDNKGSLDLSVRAQLSADYLQRQQSHKQRRGEFDLLYACLSS